MERMTLNEVARLLRISVATLTAGLRTDKFPFGVAIKGERHYSYIILKSRFEAWVDGNDMQNNK